MQTPPALYLAGDGSALVWDPAAIASLRSPHIDGMKVRFPGWYVCPFLKAPFLIRYFNPTFTQPHGRIVGTLVGAQQRGPPLYLMPEEAALLVDVAGAPVLDDRGPLGDKLSPEQCAMLSDHAAAVEQRQV